MTDKKEMIEAEVVSSTITPMTLIQQAQQGNASIEQMQQLFDLQLRWEDHEAKKAYHKAVAAFKSETIMILKDKAVGYSNKDGTFTGYKHSSIGNIINTITPFLSLHGLSHAWDITQENNISVTCRLSHEGGHSTTVSMTAAKDDSGKKNAIQQIASTVTYLQRYTLLSATGLAASDQDDDGKRSGAGPVITESQLADLEGLILDVKVDVPKLITYLNKNKKMSIDALEDLPAEHYNFTCQSIETKRGK